MLHCLLQHGMYVAVYMEKDNAKIHSFFKQAHLCRRVPTSVFVRLRGPVASLSTKKVALTPQTEKASWPVLPRAVLPAMHGQGNQHCYPRTDQREMQKLLFQESRLDCKDIAIAKPKLPITRYHL